MERVHDEVLHVGGQHSPVGGQVFVIIHQLHLVRAREFVIFDHQNVLQFAHTHIVVFGAFLPHDGDEGFKRALSNGIVKCEQLHGGGEIMRRGACQRFKCNGGAHIAVGWGSTNIIAGRDFARIQCRVCSGKRVVSCEWVH